MRVAQRRDGEEDAEGQEKELEVGEGVDGEGRVVDRINREEEEVENGRSRDGGMHSDF